MTDTPSSPPPFLEKNNAISFQIGFSLLFFLGIIALSIPFFKQRQKAITREVQTDLSTIADLKAEQIVLWCKERKADAEMIAADPYLARQFAAILRAPGDTATRIQLTGFLKKLIRLKEYRTAALLDTAGHLLLQASKLPHGHTVCSSQKVLFQKALSQRRVYLSDLHTSDDSGHTDIHLSLFAPLVASGTGTVTGAVVLDLDPSEFLFPLIQSWPTPSTTAEVLLIRKDGDSVLFLNELRHRKNSALRLRLPLTSPELPAARVLSGFKGAMEGKDYRGVPVLAVGRAISGTGWHMIAKMDTSEAMSEVRRVFTRAAIIIMLLALVMGLLAALYQRHRSSRIYKMLYHSEHEKTNLASTLSKSEERFRRLFESMTEGVALHDVIFDDSGKPCNYRITTVNPAFERHTGVSPAAAANKLATELYGTPIPPYFEEYTAVGITGTPYSFETYFPPMNKHFSISVFSPGKNQFATVFEDISARKNADAKLRESEERFRRIFEDGLYGMAMVDKTFTFIHVNSAFCTMIGYTADEFAGLTFKEITHPDHQFSDVDNVKKVFAGSIPFYKTEKRYLRKDGGIVWGAVIITSLRDKDGVFQYFLAMIEDITDRKKAEEALRAEKERLLVTLRSIGDAVIATDINGRIVLMNKVAENLTGWEFADAEGKLLTEVFVIINEITRIPCENPVEKVLKTGSIVTLANHTVLLARDGSERVITDSGAPIKNIQSITIGVVLVFRDNTEKQKTQAALQKAQQLESLGVLAGGIAHDFNNLLGGLFGYLDLARESIDDNNPAAHNLDKAFSVFGRAKDLTAQLLTFAKGGAPARKVRSIAPFLRDTVQFALSGSSIRTEFDFDADLWNCSIDEHQISQVLDNLIINARDAMPRGGTITVTAKNIGTEDPAPSLLTPGKYVRISIRDHGIGIAPSHLQHIFDPFFTTKQKGSGLGLAVSYSIITRHDGTLEVESELGRGSTFHIHLPASGQTGAEVDEPDKNREHRGTGKILIMDDEVYIRDIASDMLRKMGYEPATATCGEEAIELFAEAIARGTPFHLVLLDLTIPGGMGGKETNHCLRELSPDCPVVASSGYSDDPIITHPLDYGFSGSIKKPYRRTELIEMLEKVLTRT